MSQFQAFRRVAVPQQIAQTLETTTIPAPTRGLILDENYAFMQPGAALVCDNWKPTMQGVSLRGGCIRHCELPETTPVISMFKYSDASNERLFAGNATNLYDVTDTAPVLVQGGQHDGNYATAQMSNMGGNWLVAVNDYGDYPLRFNGTSWVQLNGTAPPDWDNATAYAVGDLALDPDDGSYWECQTAHTSAPPTPTDWVNSTYYNVGDLAHDPSDNTFWQCFIAHNSAASGTTFLQDRTAHPEYWGGYPETTTTFAQDRAMHPNYWDFEQASDGVSFITGPPGTNVADGSNLTCVCKYRNRLFFIEASSMNAWYLPLDAVGGALQMIPLSGAAAKGGVLMFCATWSLSTGDGLGDKIVFGTNLGELLVFTGSNPSDASNWQQEGRYQSAPPMGKNAHMNIGGDLLLMTEQGIVPISACVTKSFEELELASITKPIKKLWREEVAAKRQWAWTMENWENYGSIFVTTPGSTPGYCLIVNAATGAWARYVGYDATCFARIRENMFFGTQGGVVMQADRTGYDDGIPYTATLVGGWEMFQAPAQTIVWRQARASFASTAGQPFVPQLSACVDYVVRLPAPPPAGPDPGVADVWDEGLWGPDMGGPPPPVPTPPERLQYAQWDQPSIGRPIPRNTRWVSIGKTGFSHAPIVQITVAQQALPNVDLIAISATFERCGIDV